MAKTGCRCYCNNGNSYFNCNPSAGNGCQACCNSAVSSGGYWSCQNVIGKDGGSGSSVSLSNNNRMKRNGRLPGFDDSQPQSQPYRVSMTASSPSIGPAAGVIGFDGSVYNDRYSNFTRGYFLAAGYVAALGLLGIVGLFRAGQGKPNLLKFTGGAAVGLFGAGYINKTQMRKNYRKV